MAELKIRVGVPVLVTKDEMVLLGESNKQGPQNGHVVVPGGGVDFGEKLEETAHREIMEETGIEIENVKFFKPYELIDKQNGGHRIMILHTADYAGGEITASDDLSWAKFCTREEIAEFVANGKIDKNAPPYRMLMDTGFIPKLKELTI